MKKPIPLLVTLTVVGVLLCLVALRAGEAVVEATDSPAEETEETVQEETPAPALEIPDLTPPKPDTDVVEALAKTVYGEARGCSTVEQAAVIWCILNRVDAAGTEDIMEIIIAPYQFEGYDPAYPVESEIEALVIDVLTRWQIEKTCVGGVGRVLPSDYLWFTGDGTHNYFRNDYTGSTVWDWSLPNPYEEEVS